MQTELDKRYHNPSVKSGVEVISQFLDDEALGLPIEKVNSGRYRLEITEAIKVRLESKDGSLIFYGDLDKFMREGIIGEQRFTVISSSEDQK